MIVSAHTDHYSLRCGEWERPLFGNSKRSKTWSGKNEEEIFHNAIRNKERTVKWRPKTLESSRAREKRDETRHVSSCVRFGPKTKERVFHLFIYFWVFWRINWHQVKPKWMCGMWESCAHLWMLSHSSNNTIIIIIHKWMRLRRMEQMRHETICTHSTRHPTTKPSHTFCHCIAFAQLNVLRQGSPITET